MATKSLFTVKEAYTDEAIELTDRLKAFLYPLFCEWTNKGYSPRAILTVAIHEATNAELEALFNPRGELK